MNEKENEFQKRKLWWAITDGTAKWSIPVYAEHPTENQLLDAYAANTRKRGTDEKLAFALIDGVTNKTKEQYSVHEIRECLALIQELHEEAASESIISEQLPAGPTSD